MGALSGARASEIADTNLRPTAPARPILLVVPAPRPGGAPGQAHAPVPVLRAVRVARHVAAGPARTSAPDRAAGRPSVRPASSGAGLRSARPVRRSAVAASQRPAPVRLTRRGRIVLGSLVIVLAAGAVMAVLLLTAPGGALASNHGQPGGGYQGMTQVVVQPGQTLWSIAAAAEPRADPRLVIQQIVSANSLAESAIYAGELLWVPRA